MELDSTKAVYFTIIAVGIIFLSWYMPVAFYNVFACDDYWFGTNVRINGLWGNQLFYWENWEGSFTHSFLASLPHAFNNSHTPFGANMFSLFLLYISLFAFLKAYTSMYTMKCFASALYLLAYIYIFTKGEAEIRFWVCANITYVSETSFLLLFLSLYHCLDKWKGYKKWMLIIPLLFLIAGSKLTFILYALSGIISHDILYGKVLERRTIIIVGLLVSFVLLNISAPGNYIRLEEETMPKEIEDQMTIFESVIFRMKNMSPYILCTLFLLPIALQWKSSFLFKVNSIIIVVIIFFVTFILDGVIMYICFHDSGPQRIYFIAEVYAVVFTLLLWNRIFAYKICKNKHIVKFSILMTSIVALSNIPFLLQVHNSIDFSNLARARDEYVQSYNSCAPIEITQLPDSHLLLSYFANDKVWLENIYLPYFRKNNKVLVVESSKEFGE